jgi:hypothetical protein
MALCLASTASALNTVATGYRVINATTPRIDAAGKCRDVNNISGNDIFIGTRTQPEWWSFIAAPPTNVTPAVCSLGFEYTTSAQKALPSATNGVSVTESGVAWTNSGWVQITASTASAIVVTGVVVEMPTSTFVEFEVDIGKGAAGSETVVATTAGVHKTNASGPWLLEVPIPVDNIAAGQRVAVRIRGDTVSATAVNIKLTYFDKPLGGTVTTTTVPSKIMPAAAAGVVVTPSGTSWANSNWFQVTASTATAIVLTGITFSGAVSEEFEVDVGVGAAGSETVVTTFRDDITNGNGGPYVSIIKPALDNIPSGSRVAIRMRKNGTSVATWKIKLLYFSSPTGVALPALPLKWSPSAAASTAITPSGVAWTNSAWVVVIPSAAAHLQLAGFQFDPGVAAQYEFDFAIGATGSEVIIASMKGMCSNTGLQKYFIPFQPLLDAVPLGAQLSVRLRISSTTTTNWGVSVGYYEDSTTTNKSSAYQKVLPTAANGTLVTPSGTNWANSAWVQLSAPIANPILITSIPFDPTNAQEFEVDLGTGAAGSETVVTTLAGNAANTNGNQILFLTSPLLIAANTRVAIRMRKTSTSVTTWGFAMNYREIQ